MAEEKREGPLKIGKVFMSKYEIVALIGQGGMPSFTKPATASCGTWSR